MRLPDNLNPNKTARIQREIVNNHHTGELRAVYSFVCHRIGDFEMVVAPDGKVFFGDKPISENEVWCLIRKDVGDKFTLSQKGLKHMTMYALRYMFKMAHESAKKEGERVQVVVVEKKDEL
jgi:hypothetical protein